MPDSPLSILPPLYPTSSPPPDIVYMELPAPRLLPPGLDPPPPLPTSDSNGRQWHDEPIGVHGGLYGGRQPGFDQVWRPNPDIWRPTARPVCSTVWHQPHADCGLPPAGSLLVAQAASVGLSKLAQPNPSVSMSTPRSTGHVMLSAGNNTWMDHNNYSTTNPLTLPPDTLGYYSMCGRSTNLEALTAVSHSGADAASDDAIQRRIDHIVAASSKVYYDYWVHKGRCSFTQRGCKFKHEMPPDTATQRNLGLFTGYPPW
ncbi:hypothetical protein C8A00DRAFT_34117 [Chaetomidium leptoderma]|uniref:C3H1-type domain-containing protein n=1 Tax=Chaetomidium leptoderma TaxID=669021 RepID=A0AAN6VKX9_9PEZI|nr:hypothetical protein C8A00DRAFT_34117 [Chaetomidium leptoderma]